MEEKSRDLVQSEQRALDEFMARQERSGDFTMSAEEFLIERQNGKAKLAELRARLHQAFTSDEQKKKDVETIRRLADRILSVARGAGWTHIAVWLEGEKWYIKGIPPWSYRGIVDITIRQVDFLLAREELELHRIVCHRGGGLPAKARP